MLGMASVEKNKNRIYLRIKYLIVGHFCDLKKIAKIE